MSNDARGSSASHLCLPFGPCLGFPWQPAGLLRGCSCPWGRGDPYCPGGPTGGQGPLPARALAERGFPLAGAHAVRTIPITFKIILLFSTYLESAVQTLIKDSVIARRKSRQRRAGPAASLEARPSFASCQERGAPSPGLWFSAAVRAQEALAVGSKCQR